MTPPNQPTDDRPNTGGMPLIEGLRALEGEEMPSDQDAVLDIDEIEGRRQVTPTEFDNLETGGWNDERSSGADADLATEALAPSGLRSGETLDPQAAAEDGIPWVPPIDPPVIPDPDPTEPDPLVAAGTGVSALDHTYDTTGGATADEDDMSERIREALRADAQTSRLADTLVIGVVGSTAVVRGVVDDLDDTDAIVAVAQRVPGIDEVRDETVVPGLSGSDDPRGANALDD